MLPQTKVWLTANIDIWERQQRDDYKHLNIRELAGLKAAVLDIDGDDTPLSINCLACRVKAIKVVFEAFEKEQAQPTEVAEYKGIVAPEEKRTVKLSRKNKSNGQSK